MCGQAEVTQAGRGSAGRGLGVGTGRGNAGRCICRQAGACAGRQVGGRDGVNVLHVRLAPQPGRGVDRQGGRVASQPGRELGEPAGQHTGRWVCTQTGVMQAGSEGGKGGREGQNKACLSIPHHPCEPMQAPSTTRQDTAATAL